MNSAFAAICCKGWFAALEVPAPGLCRFDIKAKAGKSVRNFRKDVFVPGYAHRESRGLALRSGVPGLALESA